MNQSIEIITAKRHFNDKGNELMNVLETLNDNIFIDGSVIEKVEMICISKLVLAHERLQKQGKTIVILAPSAPLRTLFFITKINQIIPSFKTIEQAKSYLREMNKSFILTANS